MRKVPFIDKQLAEAIDAKIRFGSVRKIMALLDTDNIDDTTALFKVVYSAWEQVVDVLSECFPDMKDRMFWMP